MLCKMRLAWTYYQILKWTFTHIPKNVKKDFCLFIDVACVYKKVKEKNPFLSSEEEEIKFFIEQMVRVWIIVPPP